MGSLYRYPQHIMDAALARIRAGEDKATVAAELGVHPNTVDNWAFGEHIAAHAERARAGLAAKDAEAPRPTGIHPAMLGEVMKL